MKDIYLKQKMLQICIIARDCYRLNENWAKLLGKKFAGLSRYEGDAITCDTEYHGKIVPGLGMETNTFDLAAGGKSIQLEILGALNGPSEWYNFMVERHQGIHHIAFEFTEDQFQKGLDDLKRNTGMDRVQLGSPYATPEAKYAYLATKKPVGTTMEILGFGNMGEATRKYREVSAMMSGMDDPAAPLASMVPSDVTLIVEDIETSVSAAAPLFHAEAPEITDLEMPVVYYGYEDTSRIRTAQMDMESTILRFLQPVSGDDAWANFSREARTGLYSIAFDVEDLQSKCDQLCACGMYVLQTGRYPDGTDYILLDGRKDYGAVLELRSSDVIRKRLVAGSGSKGFSCHMEFAINEMTPIKEVVATEHRCVVWEQFFPGTLQNIQASMAIAYRMPLSMVLKMSGSVLDEEQMLALLKALNEE